MYVFFGGWLAFAIQFLVTGWAWEFKQSWLGAALCYTAGLVLMLSFWLNFVVLHIPNWEPPSKLAAI